MSGGTDPVGRGRGRGGSDRLWRRLGVAAALSLLVHLALVLWGRPDYRPVSDIAVELEVVEGLPGRPDRAPEPAPEPLPEEPPAPEEPEAPPPAAPPPSPVDGEAAAGPAPELAAAADAGPADAGPETAVASADLAGDAGPGEGGGICLHDLFRFEKGEPTWLLWLSMASFRGTQYQEPLAATLGAFGMYREMAGAAGMDPGAEVEGLLATAADAFDWESFRVVASYDTGEERLRSRLLDRRHRAPGFSLRRTDQGWRAEIPGEYRWDMLGSGRVLVVESAPRALVTEGPFAEKPAPPPPPAPAPDNPYAEAAPVADAGPATAPPAAPAAPPAAPAPAPRWPEQVTCLVEPETPPLYVPEPGLAGLGLSHLRPDEGGHWPVALLATTDARVLGLDRRGDKGPTFRWALVKGFFSDPVRLEGTVYLEAGPATLEGLALKWREMAREAGADPLLGMVGLGGVFEHLVISVAENRIDFALPLTPGQVQAALLFIQLQGEAIERRIERRRRPKTPRPISLATLPDTCV